jgi:hypothetical protein
MEEYQMSAKEIKLKQEIAESEVKEKSVSEYLKLCMEFTDWRTTADRQAELKIRLNEIRQRLGMELIK